MLLLDLRRKTGLLRPHGVLSYQSIKHIRPVRPMVERTLHPSGTTYGLGPCTYDVRLLNRIIIEPGGHYLADTLEELDLPPDVCGGVLDKSTWAREFIAVQNTHIDPGFHGKHLTLEITHHGSRGLELDAGTPIAQIKFEWLDERTKRPYGEADKYQHQGAGTGPIYQPADRRTEQWVS